MLLHERLLGLVDLTADFHVSSVVTNGFHASLFSGFESSFRRRPCRRGTTTSRYTSADEIRAGRRAGVDSTRTSFAVEGGVNRWWRRFLVRRFSSARAPAWFRRDARVGVALLLAGAGHGLSLNLALLLESLVSGRQGRFLK